MVEDWCQNKDKDLRNKKRQKKKKLMMSKIKELRKKENASKGFKEWLKDSLMKAKNENYVKKQMKHIEK